MFLSQLKPFLPSDWEEKDFASFSFTELSENDPIYHKFYASTSGTFNRCIYEIYRIENPFLYCQYQIKKEEYKNNGSVGEIELYHCTSISNMYLIAENNFNPRFVRRAKFGLGVSFSPSPQYANQQASLKIGLDRAMIVADVLVGRTISGQENLKIPPLNYDTTTGNNNVYVKYYDNEFYPKYAVHYRSCDNPRPPPRRRRRRIS